MALKIQLRDDCDAVRLRDLARCSRDPRQVRRLLSLAAVHDGLSREAAATVGGMDRQTLRDRVHRFNEDGPEGLANRRGAGRPRLVTEDGMQALAAIVEGGPDPATDGVVRWRRVDLQRVIEERVEVSVSVRSISRLLGELRLRHDPALLAENADRRACRRYIQSDRNIHVVALSSNEVGAIERSWGAPVGKTP